MRQIHSSLQNMPGSWQWQLFHGCTICCSLGVTGYLLFMVHFFFLAKWLPNPWGPLWQSCVASPDVNTYANRYFHENSLANLSVPMELWYFSWMQLLLAEVFPSIRRKAQVNKTKQLFSTISAEESSCSWNIWTDKGVWKNGKTLWIFVVFCINHHTYLVSNSIKGRERWSATANTICFELPRICCRQWRFFHMKKQGFGLSIEVKVYF